MLGKLKEIANIRNVWKHEAQDFTPWLAQEENIAILSDAIGIEIEVEETESSVGSFFVDIVGKEVNGNRKVIIENQLEETDHDHLGKLITYASGKHADIIIWVVKMAREEHRAAIEWLNNNTATNVAFFLCEIKLYQIDNSKPAVKFDVVERPNDWVKIDGNNTPNAIAKSRLEYWKALQNYLKNNQNFLSRFKIGRLAGEHWQNLYIGNSLCHFSVLNIKKRKEVAIEIYIPNSKTLYKQLYDNKTQVETKFGHQLDWQELPNKKASRIIFTKTFNVEDKDDWNTQFEWIAKNAIELLDAIEALL